MTQLISVLLVDDNPTFVRIVARFLQEQHDDEVDVIGVAYEGREALALAKDLQPDVVLLDLVMPNLSGLEVIPQLREAAPVSQIIVLTLMDTEGYRQAVESAGADAFVPKASLGTDLLPAIRRVVHTNGTAASQSENHSL